MLFYDRFLAGKLIKIRDQVPATPATEEARNVTVLCIHIYKIYCTHLKYSNTAHCPKGREQTIAANRPMVRYSAWNFVTMNVNSFGNANKCAC